MFQYPWQGQSLQVLLNQNLSQAMAQAMDNNRAVPQNPQAEARAQELPKKDG